MKYPNVSHPTMSAVLTGGWAQIQFWPLTHQCKEMRCNLYNVCDGKNTNAHTYTQRQQNEKACSQRKHVFPILNPERSVRIESPRTVLLLTPAPWACPIAPATKAGEQDREPLHESSPVVVQVPSYSGFIQGPTVCKFRGESGHTSWGQPPQMWPSPVNVVPGTWALSVGDNIAWGTDW